MSILSGTRRLIGGVLVEIDDPDLEVSEAATRVKFVFEDKLGLLWPDAVAKLSYALAPNTVGETRFIAVYGLDAGSQITKQVCEGQGCQPFIDLLDRVASAAERLLKRPPELLPGPLPVPVVGEAAPRPEPVYVPVGEAAAWEKPLEQMSQARRDAPDPRAG